MTQLDKDLEKYANEFYTRKDLYAGLKLILKVVAEIGGLLTVIIAIGQVLSLLSVGLAWVGLALSPVVARQIMYAASKAYLNASAEDRKSIRAVARWIGGDFSLDYFDADNIVDNVSAAIPEGLGFIHDLLQEPFIAEAGKAFLSGALGALMDKSIEDRPLNIRKTLWSEFLKAALIGVYGFSIRDNSFIPNQDDIARIGKYLANHKRAGVLYQTFIDQQIDNYINARSVEQQRIAMQELSESLDDIVERYKKTLKN